ncbi:MAG: MotE family protein [Pseudomonadota bacterium]
MRLLPLTIALGAAIFALRAGDLWRDAGLALAQQPPAAPQQVPPPKAAPPAQPRAPQSAATTPSPARGMGDSGGFTPAEIEVLHSLAERRAALDQRAADVDRRDALIKAAEGRLEAKLQELRQLQASVESALRRYDEQEEARKKSLVKIFETMKSKDAARIFDQMDMAVLIEVVERMKEARVAPILAELAPARAKEITVELARRRQPARGG